MEPLGADGLERRYIRHEIVADVVSELTSGSSCGILIVGEHGAGKSFVAQRALEQLGEDFAVIQIRGSSISSTLPYGALSVLLHELDSADVEHPLMVLRGLTQLLRNRAQGRTIVLFVDNAHELDELSAMMIAQLSVGGHVRLLAACGDLPNVGGDIMGLWKDDLLRRVDLGAFDFSEAAATLSRHFGGYFSHTAARELWTASGGNALFLFTLAKEQVKLGILVRQEEFWLLGDGPIALTGEIRDVVKARMNRFSQGQRDVIELLALAGAVPLPALMRVSQPRDMDALQECSMIEVSHKHPPMVSIANAVTATIVANAVPPGRSAELRRRLTSVLDHPDLDDTPGLSNVTWAINCGQPVTATVALAAARAANRASDPATALRFIKEIDGAGLRTDAAIESLQAYVSIDNHDSARRILRQFDREAGSDLSFAEWTALQLAASELDRRSHATTANARRRLSHIESKISEQSEEEPDLDSVREMLLLAEAELAVFEGRHRDVLSLDEGSEPVDLGTEPRILAASLLSTSLAILGQTGRAVALGGQIVAAALDGDLADRTVREVRGRYLQLLLLAGEFGAAGNYVAGMSASNEPQSRLGGMFEIVQGVVDFHRGRVDTALPRLEAGARQLRTQDPDGLVGLATAACAYAAALGGDHEKASLYLAEITQLPTRAAWLTSRLARLFELCACVELGQGSGPISALLSEGDADAGSSAIAVGIHFLSAAVRAGDVKPGTQLGGLSRQADGYFALLCRGLADGLKESNSEALMDVCRAAETAGNAVFARDVARKAVNCAQAAGNKISLRVAQRALQSLDELFRGPTGDVNSLTAFALTARECEVAVAAAAGISNRRIAEQMHVSVRTVEGHLYQVYAKLHLASRTELRDVVNVPAGRATTRPELPRRRRP
ncbi:LuxR C-terminal-related transcriptional regulator [Arthrobacter sp. ISL-72]|uniref:LuxR C-terminal-related transcriptional regulator n=1 Tax=Arthrobacter sp. ISL-72 TaxID=2819114 RepID=UPI001BE8A68A|nr:LuxR C-terminal-related transcriptional regulator [Arthrobacter sp. ISL-72]MBT2595496.1 AAA family ATPase [Arthrobacter sp. ISL-72]